MWYGTFFKSTVRYYTQSLKHRWYCTFFKSTVRRCTCTQSVTLSEYCTYPKYSVSYCSQSASSASVSLYICLRSLDMGAPITASWGGNKMYLAYQVNIIVLQLGFQFWQVNTSLFLFCLLYDVLCELQPMPLFFH